ncbi:MAG: YaaL family protein [Clostridiales bacterium]|jgi:hypothetical protein|nr:YaaL family protein [Clostridiales bacterium]
MSANVNVYSYPLQKSRRIAPRQALRHERKRRHLAKEDVSILATLEKLQGDLANIHRSLDAVTDPDLIDSFIYEMNAINMRYKFYLQMCKDKGLVSAMF